MEPDDDLDDLDRSKPGREGVRGGESGGDCTDDAETNVSCDDPESSLPSCGGSGVRSLAANAEAERARVVGLLLPLGFGGVGGRALRARGG